MTEDEMVGWHHRLNGYGFGWTQGAGDGQGGLACCSPWGPKESVYGMLAELGINNNVSPKDIVSNRIVSYIRALDNRVGSNVLTLYRLVRNRVEALEFLAKRTDAKIYNVPLRELKIKNNCLIACIMRDNKVIIPGGNTCIQLGDNVIVVTTHKDFDDLTDIFE